MPGVPLPMKIVLAPIEVLGMFTKPFSLLIRLFANITAGHSVVMGLIAVAFVMKQTLTTPGAVGVSFLLTLFLTVLEILVAFLQAFIFTMLSSLFIGSAVEETRSSLIRSKKSRVLKFCLIIYKSFIMTIPNISRCWFNRYRSRYSV